MCSVQQFSDSEVESIEIDKSKRNLCIKQRMRGQQYIGRSKNKEGFCQIPPRVLGPSCTSHFCEKSSNRNCSSFNETIRMEIFETFWEMSWEQKKLYVRGLINCIEIKRLTSENSQRTQTIQYFLKNNFNRLQVCRQMFLSTLGVKEKMVRNWITNTGKHGTEFSGELKKNLRVELKRSSVSGQRNQTKRTYLESWLKKLPKMESHYCRQQTKKLYFEASFASYNEIYKLYVDECESEKENANAVSYPIFVKLVKDLNYSIFHPKKDECDFCVSYKVNNIPHELYEKHREEIEIMRDEKRNDIENAISGLCVVLCIDMQAVKLIPQLNANAAYYKMKLQVHNFTIYNLITHESDNYVWDETNGNLVASTFATIIIKHLRNIITRSQEINHIIIYSDGCFYQNRNVTLSNALLSFCVETNISIEHKYLVKGHTQMECDSTHSLIERKIKNRQINLPSQFEQLIREARKTPIAFQVHHLQYDYFQDFESIPLRYSTIRPGVLYIYIY